MRTLQILCFFTFLGVSLFLLPGCNSQNVVPVSGTVTIDGKPAANVRLAFRPVATDKSGTSAGYGAIGTTDANGHYEMEIISATREGKGASVGKNRVKITLIGDNTKSDSLPSLANGSPIKKSLAFPWGETEVNTTIDVPANGTNSADFALPLATGNSEEPSL